MAIKTADPYATRRGAKHYSSKLTEKDVRAIRRRLKKIEGQTRGQHNVSDSLQRIAYDYGVSRNNIRQIKTGRAWGWLK